VRLLRGGVLSVPDFRRLWLVGLVVSVARWLEMLVIGLVVWERTHSAFLVAFMVLLRLAPMGLFGALLGVVADRVERRRALLLVLALQAAAIGSLAALAFAEALAVWQVAVVCFVNGFGWATDNPVRRMMVGDILGPERLGAGMSLDVMANNASRVAGPALGGTMLAGLGAGPAFALSLALYLAAIGIALRVTHRGRPVAARTGPVLREMRESFGLALRLPALRGVLVVTVVFNIFAWPFTSMVPVIGAEGLRLGPEGVGILASMDGLGALFGAALVGLLARPDRYPLFYLGGTVLYLGMICVTAAAPTPVLAGAALLLLGFGNAAFGTMQATLVYLVTPPELRGRALGVLSAAIGTGLIGFLHIGVLAAIFGARTAALATGLEGLLALALTWRSWRAMRTASSPQ
jgi:MFS family permease